MMRSVRGTVFIEFLLSFLPFFLVFVGGVQLALIATARIVVQHAAVQAVRAAVVAIDDDPYFYEGARRKYLEATGNGKGTGQNAELLSALGFANGKVEAVSGHGSARLKRVRNAAYLPLSILSPSPEQLLSLFPTTNVLGNVQHSLAQEFEGRPEARVLAGLAFYVRTAAAVTFPTQPGSPDLRDVNTTPFADRETVHLRVSYLFPCAVPLARELICRSLWHLRQQGKGWNDLKRAELASSHAALLLQKGERFLLLQGEASLPNHGAAYKYYSELKRDQGG